MSNLKYKKRVGTTAIHGQLYESKLISLILFRAQHDGDVTEFYIGTNVDGLGEFDDICFRLKMKGIDKPVAVFIQTKHRDDMNKRLAANSIKLPKYFNSYLKIRNKFDAMKRHDDAFFKGTYDDIECAFIYYTNIKDDLRKDNKGNKYIKKTKDIIGTGDDPFRISYTDEDIKLLQKMFWSEKIKNLAAIVADMVKNNEDNDYEQIMNKELIHKYHVILAQRVFEITDQKQECIESIEKYRIWRFKSEFLNTNDEKLLILRDSLTKEIELSVLKSAKFKLPPEFGNTDMTLRHSKEEIRLNHLSTIIVDLLNDSKERVINEKTFNIVNIDDDFSDKEFLKTNGGIGGAVGNLLILDETTQPQLLMFAKKKELKGPARTLFEKINSKVSNKQLQKYRFDVQVERFPKLSFDCNEYERDLIVDFTSKSQFYTNQQSQNQVEDTLKNEIVEQLSRDQCNVEIRADHICKIFHDDVQKWWLKQEDAHYLTKATDLFQNATKNNDMVSNILPPLSPAQTCCVSYKGILPTKDVGFDAKFVNDLKSAESRTPVALIASGVVDVATEGIKLALVCEAVVTDGINCIVNLF